MNFTLSDLIQNNKNNSRHYAINKEANDGIKAHSVAKNLLKSFLRGVNSDAYEVSNVNAVHAKNYADLVWEDYQAMNKLYDQCRLLVEEDVSIPFFRTAISGRCDAAIVTDKIFRVYEFKTGESVRTAKDNPQLFFYARGLIEKYNFSCSLQEVTLCIYRPQTSDFDSVSLSKEEFFSKYERLYEEYKHKYYGAYYRKNFEVIHKLSKALSGND